jgi:hypothetical protein
VGVILISYKRNERGPGLCARTTLQAARIGTQRLLGPSSFGKPRGHVADPVGPDPLPFRRRRESLPNLVTSVMPFALRQGVKKLSHPIDNVLFCRPSQMHSQPLLFFRIQCFPPSTEDSGKGGSPSQP